MKKSEVNYPALITLLGLLTAFFVGVTIDKAEAKVDDDKQNIIGKFENDYGYIPKYEVEIK